MKKSLSNNVFHKNVSQFEVLNTLNKSELTRQRILKQLEQLQIDVSKYTDLSLKQLSIKVEEIMKNTYSIKYLGLNKNEMGIISRRINPLTDQQFKVEENYNEIYSIHKYFYPKPLKTGKKGHGSEKINVQNLQYEIKKQFQENRSQQNEKIKEIRFDKTRTKMLGSWCSIPKSKQNKLSLKQGRLSINDAAKLIEPRMDSSKSYSRFLTQGILIVRD